MHKALGVHVAFTPPYHASSLEGVERQHKDIKLGLQTTILQMGDEYGETWMSRLPWVMLGRKTTFQPGLDCSPAEMTLSSNPTIPGDIVGDPGTPVTKQKLQTLLQGLQ